MLVAAAAVDRTVQRKVRDDLSYKARADCDSISRRIVHLRTRETTGVPRGPDAIAIRVWPALHCLPPPILAHMCHEASLGTSATSGTEDMARPSLLPEGMPHHSLESCRERGTNKRACLFRALIRPKERPSRLPTAAG